MAALMGGAKWGVQILRNVVYRRPQITKSYKIDLKNGAQKLQLSLFKKKWTK